MPIKAGNEGVGVQSVAFFSLQSFWLVYLFAYWLHIIFLIPPLPRIAPDCTQKHTLCPDSKVAIHTSEDEKCFQIGQCTNVWIFWSPLAICSVLWAPSVQVACCTTASANSRCLPFLAMANWVVSPHDNHFLLYLKGSWYLHRFSTGSKSTPSWMILFWSFSEYLYLWSVKPTANTFKWLLSQILLLEPAQHCETW